MVKLIVGSLRAGSQRYPVSASWPLEESDSMSFRGDDFMSIALRRGIEFWVQVMRLNDNRLVKVVMLEALEVGSKVKWVKDLQQSLEKLGWRGLNVMALDGLTIEEV